MSNLKTEEWIAIVVAVALGGFVFAYTTGLFTNQTTEEITMNEENTTPNADGLEVTTTEPGDGPAAEEGDIVVVNYRGRLAETDEEFDNSYDRGQPFPVVLGQNRVIPGWELGLLGAQAGESRTLYIPSDLGYGPTGTPGGPIPGNADLIFDIEVLQVIQQGDIPTQ